MVQFYKPGVSEGALFQNNRKQHDRSPDINGRCLLTVEDCEALLKEARDEGGATLWLNGWNKQGQRGPWISLAPKAKRRSAPPSENNQQPPQRQEQPNLMGGQQDDSRGYNDQRSRPSRDIDDEIPF